MIDKPIYFIFYEREIFFFFYTFTSHKLLTEGSDNTTVRTSNSTAIRTSNSTANNTAIRTSTLDSEPEWILEQTYTYTKLMMHFTNITYMEIFILLRLHILHDALDLYIHGRFHYTTLHYTALLCSLCSLSLK
jgi:hypothetical protein